MCEPVSMQISQSLACDRPGPVSGYASRIALRH
jgi:hypothetical protein